MGLIFVKIKKTIHNELRTAPFLLNVLLKSYSQTKQNNID